MTGLAVEKGTKAVISTNFRVHGERTFNNVQTNFDVGIPGKAFQMNVCSGASYFPNLFEVDLDVSFVVQRDRDHLTEASLT
jgi:hypothetical protein